MIQTRKDPIWVDEAGTKIPYNRLTKLEVMRETELAKVLKEATAINARMVRFKKDIAATCDKLIKEFMKSKGIDSIGKGAATLFSFDRSVKVELSINDRIAFDDLTMKACKEKFEEFLNNNIDEKQAFVKDMIRDAFSTSRGKLDAKKVMSLLKYETRIQDITFQEALVLLKDSIRRPDSKTYYRVSVKDEQGEYNVIDLNFSSI